MRAWEIACTTAGIWLVLILLVLAFMNGCQRADDDLWAGTEDEPLEQWLARLRRIHDQDEAAARPQQEDHTNGW